MPSQPEVYLYRSKRTIIGQKNGYHSHTRPEILMSKVLCDLTHNIDPSTIDDCLIASAVGPMGNIARLSWLEAGLPLANSATSIDFQCGGSLKAIEYAFYQIASKQKNAVIAGGTESTSLQPDRYYSDKDPRKSAIPGKLSRAQFAPTNLGDVDMVQCAENVAQRFKLSRETLDRYALMSHQRALDAMEKGIYQSLILMDRGNDQSDCDENLRPTISKRLLARATPLLGKESVTTSGNSCLMHDGASGVLLGSVAFGVKHNLPPLARILGFSSVGCDPTLSPLGAIYAVEKLLKEQQLSLESIELMEINEAFAAKILAFHSHTGYPLEKINVNGGALAYGHPYAASGAIYLMHLVENLHRIGGGLGIVAFGVAGGLGIACLISVEGTATRRETCCHG